MINTKKTFLLAELTTKIQSLKNRATELDGQLTAHETSQHKGANCVSSASCRTIVRALNSGARELELTFRQLQDAEQESYALTPPQLQEFLHTTADIYLDVELHFPNHEDKPAAGAN